MQKRWKLPWSWVGSLFEQIDNWREGRMEDRDLYCKTSRDGKRLLETSMGRWTIFILNNINLFHPPNI